MIANETIFALTAAAIVNLNQSCSNIKFSTHDNKRITTGIKTSGEIIPINNPNVCAFDQFLRFIIPIF